MIDLHKFLINPFDDPNISVDELLSFSTDHMQRMISNNLAGLLLGRITDTTTALTGVDNAFTDDQTKLGVRKARKQAKDAFRTALPASVAKIAAAVAAEFGASAPELAECFPQGRKVFGICADDQVGNHLQTLINGVTAHQPPLAAQVLTDATALLTGWNAVYATSESSAGAKATTQAAKNAARAALQLELFKNLLTLALNFPRQPEQLDAFMQQSLLEDHPAVPPTPPPPTP